MLLNVKDLLRRVYQRQKSVREGRRKTVYEIAHDASGMKLSWLTIENERGERTIEWHGVSSIVAFKRDLFTVDLLCLLVNLGDNTAIEIDEEMNGWDNFIKELPAYLAGCKRFEDWFLTVAFPAFVPNVTEIYKRGV